ncbi:NADH-quinone oxidoreductase subunit M [Terricaulis silvestris]|uniref:NADH-quinone oxidoreductase subunit M n=1 Tax=Terricaulis silvestris TaxID=2686094 RepID=A0A6I6MR19_9CAUL|nr:NADH-quinone oxidoreductase subunit M [Terricaulis silvestris]QGZ95227.1 NADH-quinone oxidoreductase subunit M [Terricaulis silvestris]
MSEMFASWPLLSVTTFFPAAGALLILLSRASQQGHNPGYDSAVRVLTLIVTIATFFVSLFAFAAFDWDAPGYQLKEEIPWAFGASYAMGVDQLAMSLVLLTTFLTPLCILASWHIEKQVSSYMVLFLLLETLMVGVFCAQDIILFYLFFEGGLIPMFILIGVWGGERRVYAAFKFFLYTLLGSLLMLVAIVVIIAIAGTSNIERLTEYAQTTGFDPDLQIWLWLAFFASFAVKMPMWPVHTWLPDAHVEAPTAASVVLAAILLKMGGYGFLRFSLPMFPDASHFFTPLVFILSVIAIVYASLVAFRQVDMKKLIAYSSVAHMGFVTMGIFAGNVQGIQGAIFQMLSHGVISGALFLCVGVVYDRMHTREIAFYGGLVNRMPVYAAVFMLFTMGNVGLPGTSGFPGEILTMVGAFQINAWVAAGAALGVIFSAAYALTLYRKVAFGVIENPKLDGITDLDAREWITFIPLVIATLIMGLAPAYVLDFTSVSAEAISSAYLGATP